MNWLDWLVLLGTMLGIAAYGMWRTRGRRDLNHFLRGDGTSRWIAIGISVMATQASAVTFLSTPGQGYQDGMGFVQNYFGAPFALILVAAVFLPIYRRLNVYTAYEYLGKRFDTKTRLLGAALFLFQRGIGAGITVYAPAIVLSTVFGWRMDLTILCSGVVVILYTVVGGSEAVTLTQRYQFAVIVGGMVAAFAILIARLPQDVSFSDAMAIAGRFNKLNGVDYSISPSRRYTIWTGLLGGLFLALSYFGTDQTQVQRYLGGASLRESRMGLMFNAVLKIPMQIFILLLGVFLFVFYQFERPPAFFNQTEWRTAVAAAGAKDAREMDIVAQEFAARHEAQRKGIRDWLNARHSGNGDLDKAEQYLDAYHAQFEETRSNVRKALATAKRGAKTNDTDFIFITFILQYLPHGLIGLLIAVFFAATLSSKAGELNALASTTVVDVYRHIVNPDQSDRHYVIASKVFTVGWGAVAIGFALFANIAENLIQAGNIVASIFYGVILGLFIVAFFLRWVKGTAVFWGAVLAQALVLMLYYTTPIAYLWYNLIGPAACVLFSVIFQKMLGPEVKPAGFEVIVPAVRSGPDAPTV